MTRGNPFIIDYLNTTDQLFLLKISASLESQSRHPIASALVNEAKKQNLNLLTIKNINTESGRGISGELESIDGVINIGSIEWLKSKGAVIDCKSNKILEIEENKSYSIIGACINKELVGFILLGDLLREDTISSVQKLIILFLKKLEH